MLYPAKLVGRLAVAILAVQVSSQASATHPDLLRNYRVIPRHSTLDVTGGFAGVNLTYDLSGRFGLVTGFREGVTCAAIGCPPPDHIPFAEFVDVGVKALLNHPLVDSFPVSLDRFVDLESLRGSFYNPQQLSFYGKDTQGAPFRLQARMSGRLIHLVGENDPPCCDFFHYKLDAYAHLAPFADFNSDGTIDAADYTLWRDHVGTTVGATLEQGDADGDGDVDRDDYLVWKTDLDMNYDLAAFAATDGAVALPAPEPSAVWLGWTSLVAAAAVLRQRSRAVGRAG